MAIFPLRIPLRFLKVVKSVLLVIVLVTLGGIWKEGNMSHQYHDPYARQLAERYSPISVSESHDTINPSPGLLMVWAEYRAIPPSVMARIRHFVLLNPMRRVTFFCGSKTCLDQIQTDGELNRLITTRRLLLQELAANTTLREIIRKAPHFRLQMGRSFPKFLQNLSTLLVLWRYGGLYVDVMNIEPSMIPDDYFNGEWASKKGVFLISHFQRKSQFLKQTIETVGKPYISYLSLPMDRANLEVDIQLILDQSHIMANLETKEITYTPTKSLRPEYPQNESFGILSFDHRTAQEKYVNVGDEIQTLVGLQFLPFVDVLIDRETWAVTKLKEILPATRRNSTASAENMAEAHEWEKTPDEPSNMTTTIFLNSWYGSVHQIWPPTANLNPILLSMYFSRSTVHKLLEKKNYLIKHGPVGSRDESTRQLLQGIGIETYFSACLTLLMQNPYPDIVRENIFIVDVDPRALNLVVPEKVRKDAIFVNHRLPDAYISDTMGRYDTAFRLIDKYARAKYVITSRIHCALPCVGMGIPVVFVATESLPGGNDKRTGGLKDLFHLATVDKSMASYRGLDNFNWDDPDPNPNRHLFLRHRATLWHEIRKNAALLETAITFGIVPYPSFSYNGEKPTLTFFQIYTTDIMTARNRRSVESIFYHHPDAQVRIFGNFFLHDQVSAFIESGYSVQVENYIINDLLKSIIYLEPGTFANCADAFLKNLIPFSKGKFWFSHETDLVRLLLLYMYGGVYLDTDVILTSRLDSPMLKNAVAWEDEKKLNGAVLKFEKYNPYIRECIVDYLTNYSMVPWAANGPVLLTRVARRNPSWVCDVTRRNSTPCIVQILEKDTFYPIHYSEFGKKCFEDTATEALYSLIREKSFAVHLYNHLSGMFNNTKAGTLCRYLLNNFCIFCGEFV